MRWPRILGLGLLLFALTACFDMEAESVIGADGAAATRMVVQLDLGAIEMFAGDLGGSPGGLTDQVERQGSLTDGQLEQLYEQHPGLRDRLRMRTSLHDGTFELEVETFTEDITDVGAVLASLLGDGEQPVTAVLGVDADLEPLGEIPGSSSGGLGVLRSVSTGFADGEFRFEAVPAVSTDAGAPGDETVGLDPDALGALGDALIPEIVITVWAPGEVIETNGATQGRRVRWDVDPTGSETLTLRSSIDPSVRVTGLGDLRTTSDDESSIPAVIGLGLIALVTSAGIVFYLRRPRSGDPDTHG